MRKGLIREFPHGCRSTTRKSGQKQSSTLIENCFSSHTLTYMTQQLQLMSRIASAGGQMALPDNGCTRGPQACFFRGRKDTPQANSHQRSSGSSLMLEPCWSKTQHAVSFPVSPGSGPSGLTPGDLPCYTSSHLVCNQRCSVSVVMTDSKEVADFF